MAMKRILLLLFLYAAGSSISAQRNWIWLLDSASVDTGMHAGLEISLGMRAVGPDDGGYLGNFSLTGRGLGDIFMFGEGHDPVLVDDAGGRYFLTLTNPPGERAWQINGCLADRAENGLRIIPSPQTLCRIRFAIRDPEGTARMEWVRLQQTFEGDCISRVSCTFEAPAQDISLKPLHSGTDTTAGVAAPVVLGFYLHPVHPNPFNSGTRIVFDLPAGQRVRIAVFNITGQQVREIIHETMPAGRHCAAWDGTDGSGRAVPSGLFIVRMEAEGHRFVRKIVMAR